MAILLRSAGSVATLSGGGTLTPAFGVATQSGNLLVAWVVTNSTTTSIATSSTGWVQAAQVTNGISGTTAIFYKPNCGASETAPTFSGTNSRMAAQLAEFTGATTTPLDQTGTFSTTTGTTTYTVTATGTDTTVADLVVAAACYTGNNGSQAFNPDTFNNGTPTTLAQNSLITIAMYYNAGYSVAVRNPSADSWNQSLTSGTTASNCAFVIASFIPVSTTTITQPPISINNTRRRRRGVSIFTKQLTAPFVSPPQTPVVTKPRGRLRNRGRSILLHPPTTQPTTTPTQTPLVVVARKRRLRGLVRLFQGLPINVVPPTPLPEPTCVHTFDAAVTTITTASSALTSILSLDTTLSTYSTSDIPVTSLTQTVSPLTTITSTTAVC